MDEIYLTMLSGRKIDLINLKDNDYAIEDIADSLSKIWRWNSQMDCFYSVAQHCVLVSQNVPKEYRLDALMHDAAEAYIGDMPRPLKKMLPQFVVLEDKMQYHIAQQHGFKAVMPQAVKEIDDRLLLTEHIQLRKRSTMDFENFRGVKPLPIEIVPVGQSTAERMFFNEYEKITAKEAA